jgi:hypothetical protein
MVKYVGLESQPQGNSRYGNRVCSDIDNQGGES